MTLFPKKHISQNERRNYQPKKTINSQKNNVAANNKRPLLLFYFTDFEKVFVG